MKLIVIIKIQIMSKTAYDLTLLDNTTGREFEVFLVSVFAKLGYSATVTNRSKDYGCDMMLQQGDSRIAVQAKRSESELDFTSVQRVLGSLKKYNAHMSVVVTNNKFTSSAKQLAKIKDVVLIDRKKLLDLIELSNLSVNHKKDLIQFSNKTRKEIIKQEIDKEVFNFLGLDVPKVDHSLLTKDAYGRPHPLNNKKEKLIDIFKEINIKMSKFLIVKIANGFGNQIQNLIKISTAINSLPYIAYSMNKSIKIDGWKSLTSYKVVYPRGWKVIDINLGKIHNNLQPIDTPKAGLKFIKRNRADIFVNIPIIIEPLLKTDEFINSGIYALKPPIALLNLYIYLLPRHAKEANLIEIALESMKKDGTQDKILKQ
mgnify:CR=1 FL=1